MLCTRNSARIGGEKTRGRYNSEHLLHHPSFQLVAKPTLSRHSVKTASQESELFEAAHRPWEWHSHPVVAQVAGKGGGGESKGEGCKS